MKFKKVSQDRDPRFYFEGNMNFIWDISRAQTKEEFHLACWNFRLPADWEARNWALVVAPREAHIEKRIPAEKAFIGVWPRLHDASSGEIVPFEAIMLACEDPGEAWELAVNLGFPVLISGNNCSVLIPPDAGPSIVYPSAPMGVLEAFGVVFGAWGYFGCMQCVAIQSGHKIPGF